MKGWRRYLRIDTISRGPCIHTVRPIHRSYLAYNISALLRYLSLLALLGIYSLQAQANFYVEIPINLPFPMSASSPCTAR